jgi:hypothetical protein
VGENAFGETAELIGRAVDPVISIGTTDDLGVLEGFTGGCIYGGVGGVECSIDVCDMGGENGHVMLADDVGLNVAEAGVMGMMGWEALSTFSALGASCGGTTFGPSCAGSTWVDGDAGPK